MAFRRLQNPAEPVTLIFAWRRPGGVRRRLILCLAAAVAGHLFLFYLFKVVMPASRRTAPPPRSMTFLPSRLPEAGRLMRNVRDRHPELNTFDALEHPDNAALQALVPGYQPAWEGYVAPLKSMSFGRGQIPALLPASGAVLMPPLEPVADNPPLLAADASKPNAVRDVFPVDPDSLFTEAPAPPSIPVLSVQSGLGERRLLNEVRWPSALFNEKWPETGTAAFILEVDPAGVVRTCLPWTLPAGLDPDLLNLLIPALLDLRFSPAVTETAQWGNMELHW